MEARPLDHRWVCYKCGASNDPQSAHCSSCGFQKPQTLPEQVLSETSPTAEVEERNWLQFLVGLPVIGVWIGFFVAFIPTFLFLLWVVPAAGLYGSDGSFHIDQDTGHGWVLLMVGLVHGAWLLALQKAMRVRLVMPILPIPLMWLMVFYVVSGWLQFAGSSCSGSYSAETWTNCVGERTFLGGAKYVGEFRNGKANGQGTHTFPNGVKHVGEFRDGKANGQGSHTFPNGAKYVGEWRDYKRNGQGAHTFPNGEKYVGEWRNDTRYGQGTYYRADGSVLQSGIWQNDVFIKDQ